ncbi:MAG: exo-alpha-sialidase [Gemmatimonadetes bacterium]|nr:exo-alpha-sialidase [Gemmatimonadota bacterium]MCC6773173.1 exo-alpha-sialidase [Gemmatimonadaceae bacterium]
MRGLLSIAVLCVAACGDRAPAVPATPSLVLVDSSEFVNRLGREPMVVQHPSGSIFVAGYGDTVPHLYRSDDNGHSWATVNIGTRADGAVGNSDVELAVGPDSTLYFLHMSFDRTESVGTRIDLATSRDGGATWQWQQLSDTRLDDRPWIDVSATNSAHAIWNDGAGVTHVRSVDGGRTWTELSRIHPMGGSSHFAIGPTGELAARVVPISVSGNSFNAGEDWLFVSTDRGATWTKRTPPGTRAWQAMRDTTTNPPTWSEAPQPRWVEPVAWDSTGALFLLWAHERAMWLARSRDQGATWTTWEIARDSAVTYFPYLIARGDGQLAATWFTGMGDSLTASVAWIESAGDSAPRVARASVFRPEAFEGGFPPDTATVRSAAGEYLGMSFLQDGSLGVAVPIQHPAAKRLGFGFRRYEVRR